MPYRRLPNTDKARLRALQTAYQMGEQYASSDLAYNQNKYLEVRTLFHKLEQALDTQSIAFSKQLENRKQYKNSYVQIKLYLSHFIQVLNFAIIRKEFKPEIKKFYGISVKKITIPKLHTEKEIIKWGKKIINGERERLMKGGTPIFNPKIALVTVYYEKFLQSYKYQKMLQDLNNRALDKIANLRPEVDKFILKLWNEIETFYNDFPSIIKREKSKKYGIKYFYRKNENRIDINDIISI